MDGLHISTYDAGRHIITLGGGSTTTHAYNIVRGGKIAWSYSDPAAKGEISDAVLLSNGNVLFAHQFGITEITPDKKVVWNYDAPAGYEVHTAVSIGAERQRRFCAISRQASAPMAGRQPFRALASSRSATASTICS